MPKQSPPSREIAPQRAEKLSRIPKAKVLTKKVAAFPVWPISTCRRSHAHARRTLFSWSWLLHPWGGTRTSGTGAKFTDRCLLLNPMLIKISGFGEQARSTVWSKEPMVSTAPWHTRRRVLPDRCVEASGER